MSEKYRSVAIGGMHCEPQGFGGGGAGGHSEGPQSDKHNNNAHGTSSGGHRYKESVERPSYPRPDTKGVCKKKKYREAHMRLPDAGLQNIGVGAQGMQGKTL